MSKVNKVPALHIQTDATRINRQVDQERADLGINSPVANQTAKSKKEDTMRSKLALNSPTAGGQGVEFTAAEAQNVASLVTQVPRNQENKSSDNAALNSLVTQVERPASKPKQQTKTPSSSKQTSKKKKGGGWCCFGGPSPTADEPQRQQHGSKPSETGGASTSIAETEEDIRREEAGLLGRRKEEHRDKKCLVIDLDETLVHSSFKAVDKCDFIVPVEIENVTHNVYVLVRPGAVEFLREVAKIYEIVLFTASLSKYADPLLDLLDKDHTIDSRLFRDSCVQIGYSYVKDLSRLGRKMAEVMIIDNSPHSYRFQPCNAIPITSWFDDPNDTELYDLLPVLKSTLFTIPDCRDILDANKSYQWLCAQATKEALANKIIPGKPKE